MLRSYRTNIEKNRDRNYLKKRMNYRMICWKGITEKMICPRGFHRNGWKNYLQILKGITAASLTWNADRISVGIAQRTPEIDSKRNAEEILQGHGRFQTNCWRYFQNICRKKYVRISKQSFEDLPKVIIKAITKNMHTNGIVTARIPKKISLISSHFPVMI